ncbi:MAG: FmdB family zinc ribbon protein [Thermodesulfobacteriota bacterium]
MPIYEYKCSKCGHVQEAWQKFSDPPVDACEVCGGPVKKIISNNTFHLKGTGWYVTDYSSKGSGPNQKEKKKSPPKQEPKQEGQKKAGKEKGTEAST